MRIAVIGVGLIGGSIAVSARERLGAEVCGYDADPDAVRVAVETDVLSRGCETVAQALEGAEAAFVAVPVSKLPELIAEVLAAAPEDCVVTDVGSTKRGVVAAAEDRRFVGGHPLAGAESSGVRYARGDLFEGATWYLTPTASTSGLLYERLHRILHRLGARPVAIDADVHDRILATVSHLPHVLANLLVTQATSALGSEQLPATGPSFRDATRVAGASEAIWPDIYLSNADALRGAIASGIAALKEIDSALERSDRDWITAWNAGAARDRERLLEAELHGGPLFELRASVPNRPGVIAQLALELGRAGMNIADLALHPAPDMSEGIVALWVSGEQAARAQELIETLGFPVSRA